MSNGIGVLDQGSTHELGVTTLLDSDDEVGVQGFDCGQEGVNRSDLSWGGEGSFPIEVEPVHFVVGLPADHCLSEGNSVGVVVEHRPNLVGLRVAVSSDTVQHLVSGLGASGDSSGRGKLGEGGGGCGSGSVGENGVGVQEAQPVGVEGVV